MSCKARQVCAEAMRFGGLGGPRASGDREGESDRVLLGIARTCTAAGEDSLCDSQRVRDNDSRALRMFVPADSLRLDWLDPKFACYRAKVVEADADPSRCACRRVKVLSPRAKSATFSRGERVLVDAIVEVHRGHGRVLDIRPHRTERWGSISILGILIDERRGSFQLLCSLGDVGRF